MPMQHAVLALLADGESHGYEIKTSFEDAVGPQWGELTHHSDHGGQYPASNRTHAPVASSLRDLAL